MTSSGQAKRTVTFFRLIAEKDGAPTRFPDQNWQRLLGHVAAMPLLARTYRGPDRRLIGEVLIVDGDYALKVMEPRDENSWLEILNRSGAAQPYDETDLGTLVETSVVAFLPEKNLFGIIRGSTSSPTHSSVATWLDHLEINGKRLVADKDVNLAAEPALSHRQRQQLNASDGVAAATMRISTSKADELTSAGSKIIGDALKSLKQEYGDIVVTMTLKVPRGKANDAARKTLKAETQKWESVSGSADAVKATLVHYDAEERAHQEDVNFVAQRIAIQRGVPLVDVAGEPIRNASAVRAILSAAHDMASDLRTVG